MSLFFVGGVPGAGKSTLCQQLAGLLNAQHLIASELIRYSPDPDDPTGRAVADVARNQARLIAALNEIRQPGTDLILDGHFCLLDRGGHIVPVPVQAFREIDPMALLVVEAPPLRVRTRLEDREGEPYDLDLIVRLARGERAHARRVASALNVPLEIWDASRGIDSARTFFVASRRE
jgi:adenylate kinase